VILLQYYKSIATMFDENIRRSRFAIVTLSLSSKVSDDDSNKVKFC
jgi:hypothetical protein